jgi:glycosyltransferase involved in cell wall biosynthesis
MAGIRRQADFIFDQSEFSRMSAERYLGGVEAPSETLFNPVDLELFSPPAKTLDDGEWRLLAAGTSHALYRTKSAIDTLKVLLRRGRKVRLVIAGEFRWKDSAGQVARELEGVGGHVEILPPFSQAEAPDIYRRAHLLLHTKYKDPCPTVPIEAMACGLPVVGTRSGGLPELVTGECGILAPVPESWTQDHAADPEALADAVESVMAHRQEMSLSARRRAEAAFDLHRWLGRHEQVFKNLLRS